MPDVPFQFTVLGQAGAVTPGGVPLELTPVQRRILCALLVAGAEGATSDDLVGGLWGEDACPRAHEGTLKTAISHLRRLLGEERIPRGRAGTYRLLLGEGDTLDLERFRDLAGRGRARVEAGEWAAAAALLRDALTLWGGGQVADLPVESLKWVHVRDRLLAERRDVLVALARASVEAGDPGGVVPLLRAAVADDPLDEQIHHLLMVALWRSGQRTQALRHFERAREVIRAETGADPSAELVELRERIVRDTTTGGQPVGGGRPARVPVPAQLPPDVTDFVGREAETARLVEWLTPTPGGTGVPVVCLCGPGGIGKSTLAVHVAHLVRHHYPDGQLYVEMAGMSDRPRQVADVLAELLGTLGVRDHDMPRTVVERTSLLRSLLDGRRVLIVLDDVVGMHQVTALTPGSAGSAVIVTSRAHLSGGSMRRITLAPLRAEESLRLLGEIIGRDRLSAEPEAAGQVVAACDGWPLAVRIAGARLSTHEHWPLGYFATLLRDRLRALTADDMAVAASIALSYEGLPEEEQRAFRVLALAGPGTLSAWLVRLLVGAGDADRLIEALTRNSLLAGAGVDALGQPRYRQHDLLREYAAARLREHEHERDAALERLLLGWLELADRADAAVPREPYSPPVSRLGMRRFAPDLAHELLARDPDGWLASEIGNLLGVIRLACGEGWYRSGVSLALRVSSYLFWQERDADAEDMWRHLMTVARDARDTQLEAEARHRVAVLIARQPDGPRRAKPLLDACLAAGVDRRLHARSLGLRAWCAARLAAAASGAGERDGWVRAGVEDAEHGLGLAMLMGDPHTEMACRRALGLLASAAGDHTKAVTHCLEAVEVAEGVAAAGDGEMGDLYAALRGLARVLVAAGQWRRAVEVCERARGVARQLRFAGGEAAAWELEGDALAGVGDHAGAAARYARAADLYGDPQRQERCRGKAGAARARAAGV